MSAHVATTQSEVLGLERADGIEIAVRTAIAFGCDHDAEDGADALFEQAARSSSDVLAFGLDGAL